MDDPGSDGTVGDDSTGDKDDAGEFFAVNLDSEADGTTNAVNDQRREKDLDEVPRQWQL